MRSVTVTQAKMDLDALLDAAAAGEDVRIEMEGGPAVRLVAVPKAELVSGEGPKRRRLGMFNDEIRIGPDFDDPLPDEILDEFYKEKF